MRYARIFISFSYAMAFGSILTLFVREARGETVNLACTLDRSDGKVTAADIFTLKVDYDAKVATWNGRTGPITPTLKDTFLLLGWSPRTAVLYRDTGKFGYDVKAADGSRWYARSSTCRRVS